MDQFAAELEFFLFVTLDLNLKRLHGDCLWVALDWVGGRLEHFDGHFSLEVLLIAEGFDSLEVDLSCSEEALPEAEVEAVRTLDLKDALVVIAELWEGGLVSKDADLGLNESLKSGDEESVQLVYKDSLV